jgi:hypothetical protein
MQNIFQTKRFKWMVEVVQDSFNAAVGGSANTSVDDFFKIEKNYELLQNFLNGVGSSKLIIYYLHENSGQDYEMRD